MLSLDDALPKKLLAVNGVTALSFWLSLQWGLSGGGIVVGTISKFVFYVSLILWLNSAFYLKNIAEGFETETGEFQREQVKLTLWIVAIMILMELPLLISLI